MSWKLSAKIKSMLYISAGATTAFTLLNLYTGNEKFYSKYFMPLVHKLDPEVSHNLAVLASKYHIIPKSNFEDTEPLQSNLWQLKFRNPIGIAAGFDKHGEAVHGLLEIGFGFVEIGSVTPLPQPGNEKPRVFRLEEDEAIINRYGFNSDGHDVVFERIKRIKSDPNFIGLVGINLGKNRTTDDPIDDYVQGIMKFGEIADYLVINISSPNTPGLRLWQGKDQLMQLLSTLVSTRDSLERGRKPPLLLKLAPDLSTQERRDVAQVIANKKCQVDGLVISNTTIERDPTLKSKNAVIEQGGLSGRPLAKSSTEMIAEMYFLTKGKVPIIGVGGVFSGKDAYEKIRAGASLVQLYTAFAYHGPPVVSRIKRELDELLRADGYNSISEAVGKWPIP